MGTPHSGSDAAALASNLSLLAKIVKCANRDIVDRLKPASEFLAGLQQDFHRLLRRRAQEALPCPKLFCFYEELPVIGVGMVGHR